MVFMLREAVQYWNFRQSRKRFQWRSQPFLCLSCAEAETGAPPCQQDLRLKICHEDPHKPLKREKVARELDMSLENTSRFKVASLPCILMNTCPTCPAESHWHDDGRCKKGMGQLFDEPCC